MDEQLGALEKENEATLVELMALEIAEMGRIFARLLASVQAQGLIDYKLEVQVNPAQYLPETRRLLERLTDVRKRFMRRRKLLTHRDILKIWLRKNQTFRSQFLPGMF